MGYIPWLKGLGIILVVIGHFYSSVFTSAWIEGARHVIYLFHMPLFMAISGFLYALSRPLSLGSLTKKKFLRLMLPYISISGLVLIAKWTAGMVHFPLHYPVDQGDLWAFLLYPQYGFACFLWFIYTLFLIFFIVRVLEVARIPLWLLFLVALGLSLLRLPREFCLNLVGANMVYFVFGMGLKRILATGIFDGRGKEWGMFASCLVGFSFLAWLILSHGLRGGVLPLLAAFFGILTCWFLARRAGWQGASPLVWLGGASSAIYLLHTLSMGVTRYLWEQWFGVNSWLAHVAFFFSSVLFSLIIPALLQRLAMARFPLVCKIFLGIAARARVSNNDGLLRKGS